MFPRIKVGVGDKPAGYDLADYVLGHFTKEERVVMEKSADNAIKAIQEIVAGEIDRAMNIYNKKVKQVE